MKTTLAEIKKVVRVWHQIDFSQGPLGRLASKTAILLQGKHKLDYTPFIDSGDYVVVVNADKIVLTGKKSSQKKYHSFSGYPGGIRTKYASKLLAENPEFMVKEAVRGMLPKNKLRKIWLRRLKVYRTGEHAHKIDSKVI